MEAQSQKQGPLQTIYTATLVIFLLAISVGGRYVKSSIYPSPVFPQENCEKPNDKGWQYCTIDRGWWGNDTISFKHEQSKGAFEIEVKCKGGKAWQILSKHEEIPQNIANNHAKNWCKEY